MKLRYQILICAALTIAVVGYELNKKLSHEQRLLVGKSSMPVIVNNYEKRINNASARHLVGTDSGGIYVDASFLQLQGDLYDGVVLLPSFQVSGYKVVEPDSVKFRLISYSTEKHFPELQVFTIYDGERALWSTVPRETASSPATAENGTATASYEIDVPYIVFLRMCESDSPGINLGIGRIGLSRTAIESFRDMKAFVDQGVTFPGWIPAPQ
jgi:hypothetical protein